MKVLDVPQGSSEWMRARCGIPTASRFCDLFTAAGKVRTGETPRKYMLELVGERLTGQMQSHFVTGAMERGTMLEPLARAWYQMATGNTVIQTGFITDDEGRWGASPDGITDTGGIEIKCPLRVAMLDMLDRGCPTDDYALQVQGNLWIAGRSHWDFVLYTDEPGIPNVSWRIDRNDALCNVFASFLPVCCDALDALTKRIREM